MAGELKKLKNGQEATIGAVCCVGSLVLGDLTLTAGSAAAISLGKLSDQFNSNKTEFGLESEKQRKKIQASFLKAYNAQYSQSDGDKELVFRLGQADERLAEALGECYLSRDELVQAVLSVRIDDEGKAKANFQDIAADLVMEKLGKASPQYFAKKLENSEAYNYAKDIVLFGIAEVLRNFDYFKQIEPKLLISLAGAFAEFSVEQKDQGERLKRMEVDLARISSLLTHVYGDKEKAEQKLSEFEEKYQYSEARILGLLKNILDDEVTPDRIESALAQADLLLKDMAQRLKVYKKLENQIPEIKAPLEYAKNALNDPEFSDLDQLDATLLKIHTEYKAYSQQQDQKAEVERNERNETEADILVTRAKSAQAQSKIDEAAALYEDAIKLVAHDNDLLSGYLFVKSNMLYEIGQYSPDPKWLKIAIEDYNDLVALHKNDDDLSNWAGAQNNLGNALWALGGRRSDDALLHEAITAYRAALEERTQDKVPLDWAATQNNLGTALLALGRRSSDDALLHEAITAYRAALEEWTQDKVPLDWAMAQNNLGNALLALGRRSSDDALLHEAIVAYRAALEEWTQDKVPLDWAMAQNNLGNALLALGRRSSDDALLHEAITAYRAALEERTQDKVPLDWAMTQNNLGNALSSLGERSSDDALLHDAIVAYRAALEERAQDKVPLDWAMTQNNLGTALKALGERSSDDGLLREAIIAYRAALEEWTQDKVPLDWALTQNNLGIAFTALGERSSDDALLHEAITAYRAALLERREDNAPYYHQRTKENLAFAEKLLAKVRAEKGT